MLEHEWLCNPYHKHMSEACSLEAEGTVVLSDHENLTWIDADGFTSMVLLRATRKLLLSTFDRAAFSTVVMPRNILSLWVPSEELLFLVVFFLLLIKVKVPTQVKKEHSPIHFLPHKEKNFLSFDQKLTDLIHKKWTSKCLTPHWHIIHSKKRRIKVLPIWKKKKKIQINHWNVMILLTKNIYCYFMRMKKTMAYLDEYLALLICSSFILVFTSLFRKFPVFIFSLVAANTIMRLGSRTAWIQTLSVFSFLFAA